MVKNHEVNIITCERKNEHLFPFDNVVEIPFLESSLRAKYQTKFQYLDFKWAFKSPNFKSKVNAVIDAFKPDIIHTHLGFESWLFLENFQRHDTPIFVSFHGYDASHKLTSSRYKKAVKQYLNRPEVTPVFVSEFMKLHVERAVEQQFDRAKVLYYGTDTDFFTKKSSITRKRVYLLTGIQFFGKERARIYHLGFCRILRKYKKKQNSIRFGE